MQQNPEFVKRIQEQFIPVALDTSDFFGIQSPGNAWFLAAGKKVNLNLIPGGTNTWQGYYILGADGSGYGYAHNREMGLDRVKNSPGEFDPRVDFIYTIMDRALAQFHQKPPTSFAISKDDRDAPFSYTPPGSASVLRVFSRLVSDVKGHPYFDSIGRDHCWIYAEEVKSLLDAADAAKGRFPLPANITYRIARFHLTDNARGIGRTWENNEVRQADFQAVETGGTPDKRNFRFSEPFDLQGDGSGYKGVIEGEMTIDTATNKIARFRAFAEGDGRGKLCFNENSWVRDLPLIIGIVEAEDEQARLIAPRTMTISPTSYGKHVMMQDEYRNPSGQKVPPITTTSATPIVSVMKGTQEIGAWYVQQLEGGQGSLSLENDAIRVVVTAGGTVSWHVGLRQANLKLLDGKRYRIHFEAKADSEWKMAVGFMTQDAPYHSIGLGEEITVPTNWKTFDFVFTASNTHPGLNAFFIDMGPRTGTAWMRKFSLIEER